MLPPTPKESFSGKPTPEMLAGVYLCVEAEEDLSVRPYQQAEPSGAAPGQGPESPTTERLAGVYLCVEGQEDTTVHARAACPATRP
jgi:hypothetical protein